MQRVACKFVYLLLVPTLYVLVPVNCQPEIQSSFVTSLPIFSQSQSDSPSAREQEQQSRVEQIHEQITQGQIIDSPLQTFRGQSSDELIVKSALSKTNSDEEEDNVDSMELGNQDVLLEDERTRAIVPASDMAWTQNSARRIADEDDQVTLNVVPQQLNDSTSAETENSFFIEEAGQARIIHGDAQQSPVAQPNITQIFQTMLQPQESFQQQSPDLENISQQEETSSDVLTPSRIKPENGNQLIEEVGRSFVFDQRSIVQFQESQEDVQSEQVNTSETSNVKIDNSVQNQLPEEDDDEREESLLLVENLNISSQSRTENEDLQLLPSSQSNIKVETNIKNQLTEETTRRISRGNNNFSDVLPSRQESITQTNNEKANQTQIVSNQLIDSLQFDVSVPQVTVQPQSTDLQPLLSSQLPQENIQIRNSSISIQVPRVSRIDDQDYSTSDLPSDQEINVQIASVNISLPTVQLPKVQQLAQEFASSRIQNISLPPISLPSPLSNVAESILAPLEVPTFSINPQFTQEVISRISRSQTDQRAPSQFSEQGGPRIQGPEAENVITLNLPTISVPSDDYPNTLSQAIRETVLDDKVTITLPPIAVPLPSIFVPSPTEDPLENERLTLLKQSGLFNTFIELLDSVGTLNELFPPRSSLFQEDDQQQFMFTFLAPTDDAFDDFFDWMSAMGYYKPKQMLLDWDYLGVLLGYHVVPQKVVQYEDFANYTELNTIQGSPVVVIMDEEDGTFKIHDSCVDVPTRGGHTCEYEYRWGKCFDKFMLNSGGSGWRGGYCQKTCQRCTCSKNSDWPCSAILHPDVVSIADNFVVHGIHRVLFPMKPDFMNIYKPVVPDFARKASSIQPQPYALHPVVRAGTMPKSDQDVTQWKYTTSGATKICGTVIPAMIRMLPSLQKQRTNVRAYSPRITTPTCGGVAEIWTTWTYPSGLLRNSLMLIKE
eukprot:TRINITY_DN10300_c1_g1_i1.p1 TRINITY_DN10300_c1_g1~~TRINITY_DN10300_c1_g1_i1.p1  ORF type:complete len:947 (-),score=123.54 TRINITY_DN10300_c1_g1_i1:381-3221(-)